MRCSPVCLTPFCASVRQHVALTVLPLVKFVAISGLTSRRRRRSLITALICEAMHREFIHQVSSEPAYITTLTVTFQTISCCSYFNNGCPRLFTMISSMEGLVKLNAHVHSESVPFHINTWRKFEAKKTTFHYSAAFKNV